MNIQKAKQRWFPGIIMSTILLTGCGDTNTHQDNADTGFKISEAQSQGEVSGSILNATIDGIDYSLAVFTTCFATPSNSNITEHASNVLAQENDSFEDFGARMRVSGFTQDGTSIGQATFQTGDLEYVLEGPMQLSGQTLSMSGEFLKSRKINNMQFEELGTTSGEFKVTCG